METENCKHQCWKLTFVYFFASQKSLHVKLFGDISEWPLVKLCLVHCKQTVILNEFFCQ